MKIKTLLILVLAISFTQIANAEIFSRKTVSTFKPPEGPPVGTLISVTTVQGPSRPSSTVVVDDPKGIGSIDYFLQKTPVTELKTGLKIQIDGDLLYPNVLAKIPENQTAIASKIQIIRDGRPIAESYLSMEKPTRLVLKTTDIIRITDPKGIVIEQRILPLVTAKEPVPADKGTNQPVAVPKTAS